MSHIWHTDKIYSRLLRHKGILCLFTVPSKFETNTIKVLLINKGSLENVPLMLLSTRAVLLLKC